MALPSGHGEAPSVPSLLVSSTLPAQKGHGVAGGCKRKRQPGDEPAHGDQARLGVRLAGPDPFRAILRPIITSARHYFGPVRLARPRPNVRVRASPFAPTLTTDDGRLTPLRGDSRPGAVFAHEALLEPRSPTGG
jgi:hypothetical protein